MRKPNHIVLDFIDTRYSNPTNYWALTFLEDRSSQPDFLKYVNVKAKYLSSPTTNPFTTTASKLTKKPLQNTITLHPTNLQTPPTSHNADFIKKLPTPKYGDMDKLVQKKLLKYSKSTIRDCKAQLSLNAYNYSCRNLKRLLIQNRKQKLTKHNESGFNANYLELININFLRKERMYTKLKYSRTPAYDIVSGGAAALLAGFIGFLISEKFGFELADSGDFYFFFMYMVFISFSVRPLLMAADPDKGFLDVVSLRHIIGFYKTITFLFIHKLKYLRR